MIEMRHPLHSAYDPDSPGRASGFALDEGYAVAYAYAMFGRFQCVPSFVLPPAAPCSVGECFESGKQLAARLRREKTIG